MKLKYFKLVLWIFILSAASVSKAQPLSFYDLQAYWGIKAGVNLGTISATNAIPELIADAEYVNRLSYHVGGFVNYELTEKHAFLGEINLSSSGGKFNDPVAFHDQISVARRVNRQRLDYLEIPALYRLSMGKDEVFQFFINGGPYMGILLIANDDDEITGSNVNTKENYKGANYGFTIGAGFEIPKKNDYKILLEGRYNLGLTDIQETIPFEYNTQTISITLAIMFSMYDY